MCMPPSLHRLKYVFVDDFRRVLDELHLTSSDVALAIGISRQQLSSVMAGFRPVSVRLRQKILSHEKLRDVPEHRLWKIVLAPGADQHMAVLQLDEIRRLLDAHTTPAGVDGDSSTLARVRWVLDELRARERHVDVLEGLLSPEARLLVSEQLRRSNS